jgi:rsbT co-antagonist protein RsbR
MENNSIIEHKVGNATFSWNTETGKLYFDGVECVLFWLSPAFQLLLDAIEEVSGQESATVVLETAGYRMGETVANHYAGSVTKLVNELPRTYAGAGWGKVEIPYYSLEEKKATMRITDGWEYRINQVQGKTMIGSFFPGHWAGIFSSLFNESMWYRVNKSQIAGNEYDEIEFFASPITPQQNIHDFIRQNEQRKIYELEQTVIERTKELNSLIQDLSAPVIPVLEHIIVIPLIAKYDAKRADELLEKALYGVKQHNAKYLLLDLTGLKQVDEYTIQLLHKLSQATRLLGTQCILVGMSPELGQNIVASNYAIDEIISFSTLQNGISYALIQEDMQILKRK